MPLSKPQLAHRTIISHFSFPNPDVFVSRDCPNEPMVAEVLMDYSRFSSPLTVTVNVIMYSVICEPNGETPIDQRTEN